MKQGIKQAGIGWDVRGHLMEIQNLIQSCTAPGNYLPSLGLSFFTSKKMIYLGP